MDVRGFLIEQLGGKCTDCEIMDTRVLQLHHKYKDGKMDRQNGRSLRYYAAHVNEAKEFLIVVCANHHLLREANDETGVIIEDI
jgi:hypothetical protein